MWEKVSRMSVIDRRRKTALRKIKNKQLEMWANAQPYGRPAEYR